MRQPCILLALLLVLSCRQQPKEDESITRLNTLAANYVRLGLTIGQYDPDFVDAYYGPDSLKPATAKQNEFPKDSLLQQVKNIQEQLSPFITAVKEPDLQMRATWINSQLTAFGRRIKMFAGEKVSFDEQAKELFGVQPPAYEEKYFQTLIQQLDKILPGKGPVNARFQTLADRFVVPAAKLDTLLKVTIAESKKRTQQQLTLPATENFKLEYVKGKPWSGYNWYQGKYQSLIQYNTEVTSFVDRVIDIASHEGYPGHHVYNSLLEKDLYQKNGWLEISLYPLFSPQSLIAEGSANYGVEVAFPGNEKIRFAKERLLPLATLDTTYITAYFRALALKGNLQNVRTEVARKVIDGKITDEEAIRWLKDYGLFNEKDAIRSLAFTKKYQSYVINYTFGMQLVQNYVESKGGKENSAEKWARFKYVLTHEVIPVDLTIK